MDFVKTVEDTMQKHGMYRAKRILVGLSGGADSVALTHVLCILSSKYGFEVAAAHVNHGLRGETAVRDERFSRTFADKMGIDFYCLNADVRSAAKSRKISEELAGREIRYEFFNSLINRSQDEFIATAHHKNDNAETIAMNFMRGSGIRGLCGIPYVRDNIIRPLLDVTRSEIEDYCKVNSLDYIIDETNDEDIYTRNKVRHILIPEIEKNFNSNFVDTVTKNAAMLAVDDDYISSEAVRVYNKFVKDGAIAVDILNSLHLSIATRIIRMMTDALCGTADISSVVINSVIRLAQTNRTGSSCDIARNVYAKVQYGNLILDIKKEPCGDFEYMLTPGETVFIPELGYGIHAELTDKKSDDTASYFSVDNTESVKIKIRNRRSGDRFMPEGMNGSKKLKDFMIDQKIPADKRPYVGIVTFDGEIGWIIGYRYDKRFKFNKVGIKLSVIY